jgi:hypothetical protein
MSTFYIKSYTDYENNDSYINICRGITDKTSTTSDVIYPCVYPICYFNLTKKYFGVNSSFPCKVLNIDESRITVKHGGEFIESSVFFRDNNYKDSDILDIMNIIHQCTDENIRKRFKRNGTNVY